MWLVRNAARDTSVFEQTHELVDRVFRLIHEWIDIHAPKGTAPAVHHVVHWTPPEESWLKINVDGSLMKNGSSGGGGVVVRDHQGTFKAGACHAFANVAVAEHAELLACRRGVQLATEIGATKFILETDNQAVARVLNSGEMDRSRFGSLIQEIKEMLSGVAETRVVWARRDANKVAHILAKGCRFRLCKTWFHVFPSCGSSSFSKKKMYFHLVFMMLLWMML